jgi:hypothetical protein
VSLRAGGGGERDFLGGEEGGVSLLLEMLDSAFGVVTVVSLPAVASVGGL